MDQLQTSKRLGERIREARARLDLTQDQVAAHLAIPRSAVSDIEAGKREVSAAELVGLADLFGESLEQLLDVAERRADEDLMLRAATVATPARAQLEHWIRLCEEYQWLEGELGEGKERQSDLRPTQRTFSRFEDAQALADEERSRLALGQTPAHVLLGVLEERVGIKVLFLDLEGEISGASVSSSRFGPAILVNRAHTPGRRVFTLAHELFHLVARGPIVRLGQPPAWHVCDVWPNTEKKSRVEQLADRFAGRLLVPPDHFLERLRLMLRGDQQLDEVDLIEVARYFGVSVQAVFVQLALHKLVPWDLAVEGYRERVVQERIVQAAPEAGAEPERFRRLAIKAYRSERISRARLAELLGIAATEVDETLSRHGAGGTDRGFRVTLPR